MGLISPWAFICAPASFVVGCMILALERTPTQPFACMTTPPRVTRVGPQPEALADQLAVEHSLWGRQDRLVKHHSWVAELLV